MLMSLGEPARRGECQMRWDTFEGQHQDEQEELWAAEITSGSRTRSLWAHLSCRQEAQSSHQ